MRLTPSILLLALAMPLGAVEAVKWSRNLPTDAQWLASETARRIAENLLLYQYPSGGWPKNIDMAAPLTAAQKAELAERPHDDATIDNGATTTQIAFLARIHGVTQDARYRAAAERGIDYLLAAQYPNGGWPQYFPLRKGYYTHITFNDGAMIDTMTVLRDLAAARPAYAWANAARRAQAKAAVERGIECILKCQVVQDGKLTAWAAQHDEQTLAPAWARRFEPPSLASAESVGIVRFLMSVESPSPDIVAAIDAAVAWLDANKITGFRSEVVSAPDQPGGRDRVLIADEKAPPLWARFYELGTNRPLFMGRDSVARYQLAEIEHERRVGYSWYSDRAAALLAKDYPRWRAKLGR